MPNQQGPFSEYLTQSAQPRVPQPTGLEGSGASIAYIGSKFLEGLRHGRMQRAALAEMENAKTERAYEQAIHMLDQAKDVDPTVKSQLAAPLMQAYLGHIAGQKESSKDTGHHFTDWVKSMATNLVGGQLPKGKAPLDMGMVGQVLTSLNDPNNKIQNRWLQLRNGLNEAIKGGGIMTQEAVYGLPAYQSLKAYEAANGIEGDYNQIKVMPVDQMDVMRRSHEANIAKQVSGFMGQPGQQATTPSGGMSASEVGAEAPQPPTSQPPPSVSSSQSGNIHDAFQNQLRLSQAAKSIKFGGVNEPKMGDKINATWEGHTQPGRLTFYSGVMGRPDGYYDEAGNLVKNPVVTTPYNPALANETIKYNPGPDAPESIITRNKITGESKPIIGPDGKPVLNFDRPNVVLGTFENADKSQYQAPVVLHQQRVVSGPPSAAPSQSSAPPPSSSQDPYWAPNPRPVAPAGAAGPRPVGPLHKQPTVPDSGVIDNFARQLRSWSVASEDLSADKVNPDTFRLIQNKAFSNETGGYVMPTRRNKDKVDAAEKLANNIMPKYKALLDATKGTGALFAWTKGNALKVFGPLDPKLNGLVDSINAEASNLATTIGGEMRPTDADAERALKAGPDARKSYEVNQALLSNFERAVYNSFKSATAGAPDDQVKDIASSRGGEFGMIINRMHSPKKAKPVTGKTFNTRPNPFRGRGTQTQSNQSVPEL